jgi:hypothetical protein
MLNASVIIRDFELEGGKPQAGDAWIFQAKDIRLTNLIGIARNDAGQFIDIDCRHPFNAGRGSECRERRRFAFRNCQGIAVEFNPICFLTNSFNCPERYHELPRRALLLVLVYLLVSVGVIAALVLISAGGLEWLRERLRRQPPDLSKGFATAAPRHRQAAGSRDHDVQLSVG